ncbi:hypothetical protein JCM6882_003250 [Rhodosporidiobolus microsporus]
MHRFWNPVHAQLHTQIVNYLARPTLHAAVFPLFHLNKHFRSLILGRMRRMLDRRPRYTKMGECMVAIHEPDRGAYLKIHQAESTFDQGISLEVNDPRELFLSEKEYPDEEGEEEDEDGNITYVSKRRPSIQLYMTYMNPVTLLCTFKAVRDFDTLDYTIFCDPETGEEPDDCESMPASFQIGASTWFRPATDDEDEYRWSHGGMVLAPGKGLYPPRTAALWPNAAEKRGEELKQPDLRCTTKWIAGESSFLRFSSFLTECSHPTDVTTQRLDGPGALPSRFGPEFVPVRLEVHKLTVPLFDVFFPPVTAKDDLQYPSEGGGLKKYLEESYRKGWEKAAKEELAANLEDHGLMW